MEAHAEAAHRDHETYSSNHGTTLETMSPEPVDTGMIIYLDPPKHTMLRKLVTPRRVYTSTVRGPLNLPIEI